MPSQTAWLWIDTHTIAGALLQAEQALMGDTHQVLVLQENFGSALESRCPLIPSQFYQLTTAKRSAGDVLRIKIEAICAHQSKFVSFPYGIRLFHLTQTLDLPHGTSWKTKQGQYMPPDDLIRQDATLYADETLPADLPLYIAFGSVRSDSSSFEYNMRNDL